MNPSNLQLVVVGSSPPTPAYHTIRYAGGGWQGAYGNINDQESNGADLTFSDVAAAGINGDLHVVALTLPITLYHTIRASGGGWQGAYGNINDQESNRTNMSFRRAVSAAGTESGILHVVAVGINQTPPIDITGPNQLWHTMRDANGSWQTSFVNINEQVSNGSQLTFSDVACTTIGEELHVVSLASVAGGAIGLYYIIRSADGTWQDSFTMLQAPWGPDRSPTAQYRISCAAIDGDVHIIVVADDFWHTIRLANGSWQDGFDKVNDAINKYQLWILDVGCGNVGGDLHVVVLNGNDSRPWHTIRFSSNGSWQDLRNVADQLSNGTAVRAGALSVGGTV